jgi:hypothetical protein
MGMIAVATPMTTRTPPMIVIVVSMVPVVPRGRERQVALAPNPFRPLGR